MKKQENRADLEAIKKIAKETNNEELAKDLNKKIEILEKGKSINK